MEDFMACKNTVKWLYEITENHSTQSGFKFEKDYVFYDKTGIVRLILEQDGRITVTANYTWNGCSPKFCFLDLLWGTPDGVVDKTTRKPKTYYATLYHDAFYQFIPDGLPISRVEADRFFLEKLKETNFWWGNFYFLAVRVFGGIGMKMTKQQRMNAGKKGTVEPTDTTSSVKIH
jgi:hypothetical protein